MGALYLAGVGTVVLPMERSVYGVRILSDKSETK